MYRAATMMAVMRMMGMHPGIPSMPPLGRATGAAIELPWLAGAVLVVLPPFKTGYAHHEAVFSADAGCVMSQST
jgi:hypothetical protein